MKSIVDYFKREDATDKNTQPTCKEVEVVPPRSRVFKMFSEDGCGGKDIAKMLFSGAPGTQESSDPLIVTQCDERPPITIFCDGSCVPGKCGGFAAVFPDQQDMNISEKLLGKLTNNRAEYMGLIRGLQQANVIDPLRLRKVAVFTDSELLVNTINKWMRTWKRNGWKKADNFPVKNLDLVKMIDDLIQERTVIVRHVRAHTGQRDYYSIWNDVADRLAKQGARAQKGI